MKRRVPSVYYSRQSRIWFTYFFYKKKRLRYSYYNFLHTGPRVFANSSEAV